MNKNKNIEVTRKWVQTVVIDLNLCPFAQREIVKESVRFTVSEANTEEQLLVDLSEELKLIEIDEQIETTLLIHPFVLENFDAFNQFLYFVDELLLNMNLEGVFQVANFHPHYQFADTEVEDVENFTNRSPYPMLHIIRESSLDKAIDSHPNTNLIPETNNQLMREMGPDKMKAMLRACFV